MGFINRGSDLVCRVRECVPKGVTFELTTKGWSRNCPRLPSSAAAELGFNLRSARRQILSISHDYMQLNLCPETSSLTPATGHRPQAPAPCSACLWELVMVDWRLLLSKLY